MATLVAWLTGLSGAGKSTIAAKAAKLLQDSGQKILILDGDAVRSALSPNLGFSREEIIENDRRLLALCQRSMPEYDVILVPKISPFKDQRDATRLALGSVYAEVYIQASLATVTQRDPKGLYQDFKKGRLPGLVGVAIDVPYEMPENADLILDTESYNAEVCASRLVEFLQTRQSINDS